MQTTLDFEIFTPSGARNAADLEWHPHPKFAGVALQPLITAADTDGKFSVHRVRIDPACSLGAHVHAEQWELHQVLAGAGMCRIGDREIDYHPGCLAAIPQGSPHSVQAGPEGLVLLATFCPPLL